MQDYYKLLELPRDATREQIIAAAKDKNAQIKAAFATLTDPAKRRAYDAKLPQSTPLPDNADKKKRKQRALFYANLSLGILLPPLLLLGAAAALAWGAPLLVETPDEARILRWTGLAVAVCALLLLMGGALRYARSRVAVYADEVVIKYGLLRRRKRSLPFYRIKTLEVKKGLWWFLGGGSVLQLIDVDDRLQSVSGIARGGMLQKHYFQAREEFDKKMWTGRLST